MSHDVYVCCFASHNVCARLWTTTTTARSHDRCGYFAVLCDP